MARIVRANPYLTKEFTGADVGRTPAVQHYEKQVGADGASSNTVFTLSKPYVPGSNTLLVFVEGAKAVAVGTASAADEYEETNSTTITFGASLGAADVVEFMVVGTYFIQDTDLYLPKEEKYGDNLIINGEFNIWQREVDFNPIASGDYCADRWVVQEGTDGSLRATASSDAPDETDAGFRSASILLRPTVADTSITSSQYAALRQKIEGYLFKSVVNQTVTLSFWVKSSLVGTYCVSFHDSVLGYCYVDEYTVNSADTWEFKTVTLTLSNSAGTWNYNTGIGLDIFFSLCAGPSKQTTPGSWQAGFLTATSNQVNFMASTGYEFRVAAVRLEKGPVATPYTPRSFMHELMLCQRYYEKSYNDGIYADAASTTGAFFFENGTGGNTQFSVPFKVVKRANPTVTTYGVAGGGPGMVNLAGTDTATGGGIATSQWGFKESTSLGSSTVEQVYCHWLADAEL